MEEIRPGQHHCQEIWPSRGFRARAGILFNGR